MYNSCRVISTMQLPNNIIHKLYLSALAAIRCISLSPRIVSNVVSSSAGTVSNNDNNNKHVGVVFTLNLLNELSVIAVINKGNY